MDNKLDTNSLLQLKQLLYKAIHPDNQGMFTNPERLSLDASYQAIESVLHYPG